MGKLKITPELAARLNTLARELPPIARQDANGNPVIRKVQVTGQKILDDGYKPHTKDEPPIDPKLMYLAPVLVFYNHRTELENAYKRSGDAGVDAYVTHIKALKTNLDEQTKTKLSKEKWYNKILKKLRGK